LPASLVLATAVTWSLGRNFSWRRVLLATAGLAAFGLLFNVIVVERVQSWSWAQYFNHHTLTEGGLAGGALVVGLGLLPVIAGIASLWLPERFGERAYSAFAVYLGSSLVTVCVYTAAKAAYLLGNLRATIEERNLFYLSPLLLTGTVLAFRARRLSWVLVGAATVLVLAVSWSGKLIVGAPYFDAPGLANMTLANRDFRWDVNAFHILFLGMAAGSVALLVLRRRRGVLLVASVLVAAWLLTGEVYATTGNTNYAKVFARMIPAPRDWVDQAARGKPVTFLGQGVTDGNPLWLTEFWNRRVGQVGSLNGVAPGPGPIFSPQLESTDGRLSDYTGAPLTLASGDVRLAAPVVAQRGGFTLYRTPATWHLLDEVQNVYGDGWATTPINWFYFPRGGKGVLTVALSRAGYTGSGPPGHATVKVGEVKLDRGGAPELGRVVAVRRALVRNGRLTKVRVPVARTPLAVSVTVTPTFSTPTDSRLLAAQPAFSFRRGGG
jgi:hypothetical protein